MVHIFSNNFLFCSQNGGIYHPYITTLPGIVRGEPTRHSRMFCFAELYIQSGNYGRFEKTRHFEQCSFIFYRFFRRIFTKMNPLPKPKEYAKNSKYVLCSESTPLAQESLSMEPIRFSFFQYIPFRRGINRTCFVHVLFEKFLELSFSMAKI